MRFQHQEATSNIQSLYTKLDRAEGSGASAPTDSSFRVPSTKHADAVVKGR